MTRLARSTTIGATAFKQSVITQPLNSWTVSVIWNTFRPSARSQRQAKIDLIIPALARRGESLDQPLNKLAVDVLQVGFEGEVRSKMVDLGVL